ncbi:unnamed protein product [Polarella glacialis]|uniref:C3H1-type domain-containing protein n=1 Tax=Polarella glacialis TaxID=89957 RepID=A0A813LV61_POLGL|nr:unnamed protein product [Polarella glacialis]
MGQEQLQEQLQNERQQQQQLPLHQPRQQHQLPEQQPVAVTTTPDAGTVTPASPETSTQAESSRAVAKCLSTSRRPAPRKGDRFTIASKFTELEESESEVDVEPIGAVNVPEDISRTETYSHTPTPLTPPQPAGLLIGVVSSEPQASEAAGFAAWMPRPGVSTTTARYLQQQQPQQQPRQPPLDAVHRRQELSSLIEARIVGNNSDNNNNNNNFKTRMCVHHARGVCVSGLQCSFAHGEGELSNSNSDSNNFNNKNNNNSRDNNNNRSSDNSDLDDSKFKTKLRRNYARGSCFRTWCALAHGEGEIRKQWALVTPIAEQQQQLQTRQTVPRSQAEWSQNNNNNNNSNSCRAAPVGRSRKH